MSDKLRRAQHIRARHARAESDGDGHAEATAYATPVATSATARAKSAATSGAARGKHAAHARTSDAHPSEHASDARPSEHASESYPPGQTGLIPVIGSHAGTDRTAHDFPEPPEARQETPTCAHAPSEHADEVEGSAALISVCTIISRITGFARTWAMAFALGATFVSSSYQVANNLPNMLYELVMGGMLTTAFLPVYLSMKKECGTKVSERYASNLLTLVVIGLGAISLICMAFPAQIVFTQTFYSNQEEMDLSVFFFRFFAIQVVFYGASSIISGLLNANRDYLWGAIAPVFNNLIVIATFLAYAFVAPSNQQLAFLIIAIGNPLGVFVQMAIQIPALRKNGIRLRPHVNLHDRGLRETLAIGLPTLFVTVCSFATVSVANAASYCFADNGPSVIAYSRLWFTFPYSFLAIPVATALFTELSDMQADGNVTGVVRGIERGTSQIFFLMFPFALYLIVFSVPLVTLYHVGAFSSDSINQIARYLAVLALALPFYGVNTFLQMVFSSIRKMKAFSLVTLAGSTLQIAIIAGAAWAVQHGLNVSIESIALGTIAAYLIGDVALLAYLKRRYRALRLRTVAGACLRGCALGALGACAGAAVLMALETFVAPLGGSIAQAFAYVVVAGLVSLIVTFGPAVKLALDEAAFVITVTQKATRAWQRLANTITRRRS